LEGLLQKTQPPGLILIRLHDSTSFGGTVFRERNPCDFIGHAWGHPLMVECKETLSKSIPISVLLRRDKKKDTLHQVESMLLWNSDHPSTLAGHLCHLGEIRLVVWVPITALPKIKSVSRDVVGMHGIRAIDLATQAVDWKYLFLGGDDAGTKPEASQSDGQTHQRLDELHNSLLSVQAASVEGQVED
jgi:hypothetical protein